MAAIVYLDIDDEITSAASRIRALDDDRIALVLPLGSRLATSRINFRLLAREAEARGRRIEVVTNDASARALAASAGLPTHVSVAAFESGGAASRPPADGPAEPVVAPPRPRPDAVSDSATVAMPAIRPPATPPPVPHVGRRADTGSPARRVAVLLGIVALLVTATIAGLQILPSASVTLMPGVDAVGPIELKVTAQPGITQPDPGNLLIPATPYTFDIAAADTFPTTGLKVDEAVAGGEVTFENCDTGGSVTIPAGSVVATSAAIRFRTLDKVTVKRAHLFPFACESGTVPIEAIAPGLSGNVAAGQISTIPDGFDSIVLRVTNQAPTAGGTHTETKQVAQVDVDTALLALDALLIEDFDAKVSAAEGVPAGTKLFAETRVLGESTPTIDPSTLVGTDAESFELGLTARGTVIGADPAPATTLADARLRSSVRGGYTLVEDSVAITVGAPLVSGPTITFPVTASAVATRELDEAAIRARILGLGLPQARSVLEEFGTVTISVWPDWVTTIPTNDARLTLTISPAPAPSAEPSP